MLSNLRDFAHREVAGATVPPTGRHLRGRREGRALGGNSLGSATMQALAAIDWKRAHALAAQLAPMKSLVLRLFGGALMVVGVAVAVALALIYPDVRGAAAVFGLGAVLAGGHNLWRAKRVLGAPLVVKGVVEAKERHSRKNQSRTMYSVKMDVREAFRLDADGQLTAHPERHGRFRSRVSEGIYLGLVCGTETVFLCFGDGSVTQWEPNLPRRTAAEAAPSEALAPRQPASG